MTKSPKKNPLQKQKFPQNPKQPPKIQNPQIPLKPHSKNFRQLPKKISQSLKTPINFPKNFTI